MYTHCIFCQSDLGRNEVVAPIPIGRRVAFDAAKGRLWIVCRKCERWNLAPFDERWEAIEECERLFRATRLRMSTDNIGLARLAEGLELIRIGTPLRPELAAWRYGDQFGRRRQRYLLTATIALGGLAALEVGVAAAGGAAGLWYMWRGVYAGIVDRLARTRIPAADGRLVTLVPSKAKKARVELSPDSGRIKFTVSASGRIEPWFDDDARAVASLVLPRANFEGARASRVHDAVSIVSDRVHSDDPLVDILEPAGLRRGRVIRLHMLHPAERLALEMALHEEDERRALLGELAALEQRWREAETVAAIADSLAVPDTVEQRLAILKSGRNFTGEHQTTSPPPAL